MLAHLQGSPRFLFDVWKITAQDAQVAAYANCTRDIVYGGVTYKAAAFEPTRATRKKGLSPDSAELAGVYDSIINRADIHGRRWADAAIQIDRVNFFNPDAWGSALTQRGFAGKWSPGLYNFTVEFLGLSSWLHQPIGKLTSPIDRTRRADQTGVSMTGFIHATTVTAVITQRRIFKVSYVQPSVDYFKYGIVTWTSGGNNGLAQGEGKTSTTTDSGTRTQIELQRPTLRDITVGDGVTLAIGYDGTLNAAKALGANAVLNFDGDPYCPLPDDILRYQP
jgi:uncharacterized phage protein (TIGR02218 family)